MPAKVLTCFECGATVPDTSKFRGRFKRRHPKLCELHLTAQELQREFTRQLAQDTKSVDADEAGVVPEINIVIRRING